MQDEVEEELTKDDLEKLVINFYNYYPEEPSCIAKHSFVFRDYVGSR